MTPRLGDRLCRILGIDAPIVMAGMAAVTDARLVAAVSNAGGLGLLGSVDRSPERLRDEVAAIRRMTCCPFGVNVVIADASPQIWDTALDLRLPVICTSWGDVAPYAARIRSTGSLLMHQVATVEEAERAVAAGVDVIVAQGTDGGGHVGKVGTIAIVPQVVDVVGAIPVLAAGGIVDGRGLAAALVLGAEGVFAGTRFLASTESPVSDAWKAAMIAARADDAVATDIPDIAWNVSWPGATCRVIRNRLIDAWLGREHDLHAVAAEVGAAMSAAVEQGCVDGAPLYAGQGVGAIHEVIPVAQIIQSMVTDAAAILTRFVPAFEDHSPGVTAPGTPIGPAVQRR